MKEMIRELHLECHQRLSEILEHAARIPAEDLARPVKGFAKPTVGEQINHVLYCECKWIRALRNLPDQEWPHGQTSVEELFTLKARASRHTVEFLDETNESTLTTMLPRYPDYWVGPQRTPAFILLHVLTHAFHHKGQIVAMLRLLGHPMPDTDLQRQEPSSGSAL